MRRTPVQPHAARELLSLGAAALMLLASVACGGTDAASTSTSGSSTTAASGTTSDATGSTGTVHATTGASITTTSTTGSPTSTTASATTATSSAGTTGATGATSSSGTTSAAGTTAASTTGATSSGTTAASTASSTTSGPTTGTTGTNTAGTSTTGTQGTTGATSATSGTTGYTCWPNGTYVGVGNDADCCSLYADSVGYCYDPASITNGTTGGTNGATTGTSSTTGGTTGTTGGTTGSQTCSASCYAARGYHCENGVCVLNGNGGPVQVTLDWSNNSPRAREDMDLHVIDPTGCEIYYGHRTCGFGSLDLDQNAACSHTDNAGGEGNDIENVIYAADGGLPPTGTYQVWAVDWEDQCDATGADPFAWTVTIRSHGQTQTYSGNIPQGSDVGGGSVAGHATAPGRIHVADFTY